MPSPINIKKDGYIILLVSIIVTVGILLISLAVSNLTFLGRFDTLGIESKNTAREVAGGCLQYARLQLSLNSLYAGNETRNIGSYSCQVLPIETPNASQKVIKTRAVVNNRVSNLKLTIATPGNSFVSLEEF